MNQLAITIFVLIIPGILSLIVIANLTTHKPWNSFFFSLYSIILGIFSYSLLQLLIWGFALTKNKLFNTCVKLEAMKMWNIISQYKLSTLKPIEIIEAIIIGIPLGFLVSWIINYKLLHKFAEFFRISTKYGDENLYSYYLNTNEVNWIYIRDKENEIIFQGRVVSYSENNKIQEIVLTDVKVFSYYDPKILYDAPSMYISRELGKLQIEQIPEAKFNNQLEGEENA